MAVENVILAAPCPHLDGRKWLALAHGDQYAAQTGASSVTDRAEVPVEQLRSAVDRPHDAGDRDQLFAGIPKLPRPAGDVLQRRKRPASISAQHAEQWRAVLLPPQPMKSKALSTRAYPVPAVECGPATIRWRRRMPVLWRGLHHQVEEKLARRQGHLPLWTAPFDVTERQPSNVLISIAFSTSCGRGLIPPVTSGRVIAG